MTYPTKADRARLRALEKEATPHEWRAGAVEKHHVFVWLPSQGYERVLLRMNEHFPHEADAALIAAARNALVPLLDAIDSAESHHAEALRCMRDLMNAPRDTDAHLITIMREWVEDSIVELEKGQ